MQTEIIIAGAGGQGVLFAGTLLAQAAMQENKQTTWFPSYGAEIRGGNTNSIVIISDEEIGSPIIVYPSVLIVLNESAYNKFIPNMKPGTTVVANSSLVKTKDGLSEISRLDIPVSELADKEIKDIRTANLIALGAYLKQSKILKIASAIKACEQVLSQKPKLININQKALELGYNFI